MKAKARSSIRTHKSVARTASSAAEQLHYTRPKKDSVCSDSIQKWVYWWASNYASPGLTVLRTTSVQLKMSNRDFSKTAGRNTYF